MVVLEEPDTIIPYVRICGGTGGAIRPPTRLLTLPARRSFGIITRHKCLGDNSGFILPVSNCVLCQDPWVIFLKNLHPRVFYLGQWHAGA
jgi:hypothetical protein